MLQLTTWAPFMASLVLGLVYLITGEGGTRWKALLCAVFVSAAYLQFRSPYPIAGLLLQCALAMTLAIWWKLESET